MLCSNLWERPEPILVAARVLRRGCFNRQAWLKQLRRAWLKQMELREGAMKAETGSMGPGKVVENAVREPTFDER